MENIFLFISLCVSYSFVHSLHLPSYIKPCKVRDVNFKDCAIKNGNDVIKIIMKGDKKYNIPPCDPLILPAATVVSDDVSLNITNITLYGLTDMKVTDLNVNLDKETILLEISIPLLRIEYTQKITGKISAFVIAGEGPGVLNIYGGFYRHTFSFNVTERKGRKYMTLGNKNFDLNPQKMTFEFDNLFSDNENLGNQLTEYLNSNWKEVVSVMKPSLSKIGLTIGELIIGTILQEVPVQEIFPDFEISI